MDEPESGQSSAEIKALVKKFTRQVFTLAMIETVGATALVVLSLMGVLPQETMTTGVMIWLGVISIPLLFVMQNFKKNKALLLKANDTELHRPNLIQK